MIKNQKVVLGIRIIFAAALFFEQVPLLIINTGKTYFVTIFKYLTLWGVLLTTVTSCLAVFKAQWKLFTILF